MARADIHSVKPWSQFAYVNRELTRNLQSLVNDARLSAGDRVLDYGCADQPYRALFHDDVRYEGADLPGNPVADIEINEDGTLPVQSASFDLVLSTQVLEHVEDPTTYLAECFRVLKPGGTLVLTTHGLMYYHRDPEDYWRWTPASLPLVVRKAGFEVAELRGLLGLAAAALQIFQDATYWYMPRFLRRPYAWLMQRLVTFADSRYTDELRLENSWTIAIRAVKPASP